MTENEARKKVVSIAKQYIGCKESDGSHKKIIDGYNAVKPLPKGYKVGYKDSWCATFVSFVGIKAGFSDIIPRECGCERMIAIYKKLGRWVENDAYAPKIGDVIFYDWDDSGKGNDTGFSDHVGIVVSVNRNTLKVVEGNKNDAVGYRNIKVNGKYIRGYGIPDYASKSDSSLVVDEKAVDSDIKVDSAKSFSKSLAGTYKTTTDLNMRTGAGTSKSVITVIPKNKNVTCYGYYTYFNGAKWCYVIYKDSNEIKYNGFVSGNYLKK